MPGMKLNTGLRIGLVVCILALALTAAYYYGTARAASVVALPSEITLGNTSPAATPSTTVPPATTVLPATSASSAPTAPTTSTPAQTSTTGGTTTSGATASSAKPSASSSTSPTSSVHRSVVTTVWDWNCDTGGTGDPGHHTGP